MPVRARATPIRRFAYAIALSLLLHIAILGSPQFHLAQQAIALPPLSVRLAPLFKAELPPAPSAQPDPISKPDVRASNMPLAESPAAEQKAAQPAIPQPFPRQMQLNFEVNAGNGIKVGDMQQQLDIQGEHYTLQSVQRSSGLASLAGSTQITRVSRGKMGKEGLRPQIFEEEKSADGTNKRVKAVFDQDAHKINFQDGSSADLPDAAQDVLSLAYQLALLPLNGEVIEVINSDGEILEHLTLEIAQEDISTPMGTLHTLHLRKLHSAGQPYFEIWLGVAQRLLPVKLRTLDGAGAVVTESVITSINVADE